MGLVWSELDNPEFLVNSKSCHIQISHVLICVLNLKFAFFKGHKGLLFGIKREAPVFPLVFGVDGPSDSSHCSSPSVEEWWKWCLACCPRTLDVQQRSCLTKLRYFCSQRFECQSPLISKAIRGQSLFEMRWNAAENSRTKGFLSYQEEQRTSFSIWLFSYNWPVKQMT